MKICAISANLGYFDPTVSWVEQRIPPASTLKVFNLNDSDFPPRFNAMKPRLQARIPKMFGWRMFPGFDVYLWVDASCALLDSGSVWWFVTQLNDDYDIALFKHPDRKTIQEEAAFLKKKLGENNQYITCRYAGEYLSSQMGHILNDPSGYEDNTLYASTALVYRNTPAVQEMMKNWWIHTSTYHVIDQLSLPYVVKKSGIKVMEIEEDYLNIPWITYTRNAKK